LDLDIGDTILGFIQCVTAIGLNFLETAPIISDVVAFSTWPIGLCLGSYKGGVN